QPQPPDQARRLLPAERRAGDSQPPRARVRLSQAPAVGSGGVAGPGDGGAHASGATGLPGVRPPGRRLLRVAPQLGGAGDGWLAHRALPGRRGDRLHELARARVSEPPAALERESLAQRLARARERALEGAPRSGASAFAAPLPGRALPRAVAAHGLG